MGLQIREGDTAPRTAGSSVAALLREDHERLERWFRSIVADADSGDQDSLRKSWRAFETELGGHLDTEEVHIFPPFAKDHPTEARALLGEHLEIRSKLLALGIELDLHCLRAERIQSFVDELRTHARREDQLLYRWTEDRLGDAQAQKVREALVAAEEAARTMPVQDEWHIDANRSSLDFSLRHIVVHQITGRFTRWGGTLWMDGADWTRSKVTIWVDLSSIDTGDHERDEQVRSPEFFNVKQFPKARFVSRQVRMSGSQTALVHGRLRLRGVAHDVDLQVVAIDDSAPGDRSGEHRIFEVTGSINRQEFGLHWNQDLDRGGIVVGDQIALHGRVELKRMKR